MISIITVVRNNVERIEETLISVISQKKADVEYLVIDGASTDGTFEIINSHAGEIDVIISEKDSGIYQAINKGIARASGSLIGIVHSGDTLLPGVLNRVAAEHESLPEAILYGCIKTMHNGRFESVWGWNHDTLPERMLPHPACFVPKSVYDSFGAYDESYRIAGDYEAFLRYYFKKVPFHFMDLIVQEFDLKGISQTLSFDEEIKRILEKYSLPPRDVPGGRIGRAVKKMIRQAFRGARIVFFR
jgi:glycosyltransferase